MTENADPRQRPSWFLPMLVSLVIATLISPPLRAEEQVIVQLPWQHQFQFAGYYAAIAKGFLSGCRSTGHPARGERPDRCGQRGDLGKGPFWHQRQ